jgi:hypothetical protein
VQLSILSAYSGGVAVGQRKLFCYSAVGPTSYSQTTGDAVVAPVGEYIDAMEQAMTMSKTYFVRFAPSVVGTTRAIWQARWYVVATAAEVANGVNLSAESIQSVFYGGEF